MTTSKTGLRKRLTQYGDEEFSLFLRRAFIKAMGYTDDALDRPIVGIADTSSDFNPCHGSAPRLVEAVKRGVMLAGGLPMAFPTISVHESFAHPTSMLLRNLMAMDTEEMIRAQPMDAVVLVGGCDKTLPAQVMAAVSADVPAVVLPVGPMLTGHFQGRRLGACTDCRRLWGAFRAGELSGDEIQQANGQLAPGHGTCMVMGTASTMACLVETLGLALPGAACAPAVSADRLRIAEQSGRRAAEMARAGAPRPSEILTRGALGNALVALHAIGGSTNGVVHLAAIAGRLGRPLDLGELDAIGRDTPVLVDLKPSGQGYMEDLYRSGGLMAVLSRLTARLDLDAPSVSGQRLGEHIAAALVDETLGIVRKPDDAVAEGGAIAVLRGNLAPDTAIIKHSAASTHLLRHEGPALVFDSPEDLVARIDDEDLDVGPDHVLVLRYAGPKGAPGMPEAGYIPIPRKLARGGVRDMVRISDARMSGTAFGTVVLHVCPEAYVGGPLALVRDGDIIRLDVASRRLELLVEDAELDARRSTWRAPPREYPARGYLRLFLDAVEQADTGCDFDFLRPRD